MQHKRLVAWLQAALFSALLCLFSPLALYLGPIPVTLSLFAVLLCGIVLSWKQSFLSVLLFLLLGLCGLPIFAGWQSGVAAFLGPTGGYLWSFLLVAPLVSFLSQTTALRRLSFFGALLACLCALPVCYLCGTLQFSLLSGRSYGESLSLCVIPFLLPDLLKSVVAAALGLPLRKLLLRAGSAQDNAS